MINALLEKLGQALTPSHQLRVAPPLGGVTMCDSPRQIQLFGSIATSSTPATYVPITTLNEATEELPCFYSSKVERLWRVRTVSTEVQRTAGDPVNPLDKTQILTPAVGSSVGGSGTFKFRVSVCSLSGNYFFFMDAGQPIEVYGHSVKVQAVGPANMVEVTPVTLETARSGLVIDAIVSSSILAAEVALAQTQVHFTQHVFVAANTQAVIPVPNLARALKVYTGLGAPAASWTRFIGDPSIITALNIGTVDFAGNTSIDACNQVGDATHIRTDLDPNNARFFTIIWTIRP